MARRRSTSDARTWRQILGAEARRFHEDEEGATLVFAAATFFALAMSIAFVFQIGTVSADRLQIQGAADAAAYSGALVEANSLNAMGQINDGITYVNYIAMRHAIDGVVYSITLRQYTWKDRNPTATGNHGYVIMGGDEDEGNKRIDHVKNHYDPFAGKYKRLQDTLRWRAELYVAGLVVMQSTPGLVRSTAAEVAEGNGASHIGFSDDLERAWRLGDDDKDGFTDRAYVSQDDAYVPSMYERYEERPVMQLNVAATKTTSAAKRDLPRTDWYERETGKFIADYYQVRLCWRKEDWDHSKPSGHPLAPYTRYKGAPPISGDAPNAHWHYGHTHVGMDPVTGSPSIPLPHVPPTPDQFLPEGGHGDETPDIHAGPIQVHPSDYYKPKWAHHAVNPCWNCNHPSRPNPNLSPTPDKPRSDFSEIMATSGRSQIKSAVKSLSDALNQPLKFTNGTERKPGPLMIRESLLRSGVTVMTYRRGRGLGNLLPESPWGMVAVASAQIGIETSGGVQPLRSASGGKAEYGDGTSGGTVEVPFWANSGGSNEVTDRRQNLFYDVPGEQAGFHFSARLVPIARKLTWNKENEDGSGLRQLLKGQRWFPAGQLAPNAGAPSGPPWIQGSQDALGEFLQVNSRQDLEAFWH